MLKGQASGEQGWWVVACTLREKWRREKYAKGTSQDRTSLYL